MSDNHSEVWLFSFALEAEDGSLVSQEIPESLLYFILEWAEERGFQIGGGYYKPPPDEEEDDDLLPFRDDSEKED